MQGEGSFFMFVSIAGILDAYTIYREDKLDYRPARHFWIRRAPLAKHKKSFDAKKNPGVNAKDELQKNR
jgi:hypothetical protein